MQSGEDWVDSAVVEVELFRDEVAPHVVVGVIDEVRQHAKGRCCPALWLDTQAGVRSRRPGGCPGRPLRTEGVQGG